MPLPVIAEVDLSLLAAAVPPWRPRSVRPSPVCP